MTRGRSRLLVLALVVASTLGACSGGNLDTIRGVVIEVEGDLTDVDWFVVRLRDGTDMRFEPAPGALFDDRAPMSHIRDHLRNGEPVEVRFETLANGARAAIGVSDAG